MPLSPRTLALDRIRKFLAVEIRVQHKTRRIGGVLEEATLRVTDARWLIDPEGPSFYHSRLLPGYRRIRSTGTASGTGSLLGTGIGPGTEPNRLRFSVFAGEDREGGHLRAWQDYQLKGAVVIARMGAVHDEHGAAVPLSDFEEVFYGHISQAPRTGEDVWQFEAVSPEGYRSESPLVRRTYRGLGYGVRLDNRETSPAGAANAWLSGTAANAFEPDGGYSWTATLSIPSPPSSTGLDGQLLCLSAQGVSRLEAWFTRDDRLNIHHRDGAASAWVEFSAWSLRDVASEAPFSLGVRYDGAEAHLYASGMRIESAPIVVAVGDGAVDLEFGRQSLSARPLDCIVYALWIDRFDVGDEVFRQRQAGPLRGDAQNQGGLWTWHEFIEGGGVAPPATTADLRFEVDLTLGGSATFSGSREGDHPDVSPRPQGDTMGHIIGRCYNVGAAPLERARAIFEVAREGVRIDWARLDGAPAQVAYSRWGQWALTQSPVDGIEDDVLAGRVIARDETTGQQGSEVEIYGDTGVPSCDGTYEVLSVSQGRYIQLGTPIGAPLSEITGMPREDRTAILTVTVPRTIAGALTLDAGPAVDKGLGLVGLPATGHGLDPAITRIRLEGSTSFDGVYPLDPSTARDELVVPADFGAGETFDGTETVATSIAQVSDLGDGRVQLRTLPTARLTLDVTGVEPSPALLESYTFLRNARDRIETDEIHDASWVVDEHFLITWVGAVGERSQPWSLAIPAGEDMTYKDALVKLLRSYFAWSSDAARAQIESSHLPEVRLGHFGATSAGGPVWHGRLVTSNRIEELSTESPAWRLVAKYRPNHSQIPSTPAGIPPAVQEQLGSDSSSLEIARNESTRLDFDDARDLVWETQFYSPEVAALVGQRVWDFVREPRLWRRWAMALLPGEVQVGENFTIEGASHGELAAAVDSHFFPATIEDGIVDRGVTLICIS